MHGPPSARSSIPLHEDLVITHHHHRYNRYGPHSSNLSGMHIERRVHLKNLTYFRMASSVKAGAAHVDAPASCLTRGLALEIELLTRDRQGRLASVFQTPACYMCPQQHDRSISLMRSIKTNAPYIHKHTLQCKAHTECAGIKLAAADCAPA